MTSALTTKMVSVFLTSRCTLNCKYCGAQIPKFRAARIDYDFDLEKTKQAIAGLFAVYDRIEHIDFTGGEPLLTQSRGLGELLQFTDNFKEQFSFMRILTNGTMLPDSNLLKVIHKLQCQFDFYLDNYEGLSKQADSLKRLIEREHISYQEISYNSKNQYCDGWIDFGDLEYKHYTENEVQKVYDSCLQAHHACLSLFNGQLYPCSVAPLAAMLGKFPLSYAGGLDLINDNIPLLEKKQRVSQFGHKMIEACNYCNGFDWQNAPRFPAAEQAKEGFH